MTDELPHDRDVAMVFQNYALFPHLNVFSNIAFGMRLRKVPKAEIEERVRKTAQLLGIEAVLQRRPKELSGGQRQRVALGRAIVREPRVFLMDEPLSNLDAALRMEMRAEIIKLQERLDVTTFYVTHDQVEALSMGDRIVVMRDGRIQQVGSPTELYERAEQHLCRELHRQPADELSRGPRRGRPHRPAGRADDACDARRGAAGGRPRFHARRSRSASARSTSSSPTTRLAPPRSAIAGAVDTVEPLGHTTLVRAKMASGRRLNVLLAGKVRLKEGQAVHAVFAPDRVYLFDRKSEQSLLGISE